MKCLLLSALFVGTLASAAVQAASVAIVGQTNRWTQVVPLFEGLGDTVALHGSYASIPNLQTYDIIWDADFFANAGAVEAQRVIALRLGNAGAMTISINEGPSRSLGGDGEVVTGHWSVVLARMWSGRGWRGRRLGHGRRSAGDQGDSSRNLHAGYAKT